MKHRYNSIGKFILNVNKRIQNERKESKSNETEAY